MEERTSQVEAEAVPNADANNTNRRVIIKEGINLTLTNETYPAALHAPSLDGTLSAEGVDTRPLTDFERHPPSAELPYCYVRLTEKTITREDKVLKVTVLYPESKAQTVELWKVVMKSLITTLKCDLYALAVAQRSCHKHVLNCAKIRHEPEDLIKGPTRGRNLFPGKEVNKAIYLGSLFSHPPEPAYKGTGSNGFFSL